MAIQLTPHLSAERACETSERPPLKSMVASLAAREAAEGLLRKVEQVAPGAAADGVIVQGMRAGHREIIFGVHNDPQFGPVVLVALGDIFAEFLSDVVLALPPIDEAEAQDLLKSLRGARPIRHLDQTFGQRVSNVDAGRRA